MAKKPAPLYYSDGKKSQRNIEFPAESARYKARYSETVWYLRGSTLFAFTVALAAIDLSGFKAWADMSLSDSRVQRWVTIIGFLMFFEVAPLYIGYELRRITDKIGRAPSNAALMLLASTVFALGAFLNAFARWHTRAITYQFDSMAVQREVMPIVMSAFPVATSILSILIGYYSFDAAKQNLKLCDRESSSLFAELSAVNAAIAEFEMRANCLEIMMAEDEERQSIAKAQAVYACEALQKYARLKIAESLHSPEATSVLTEEEEIAIQALGCEKFKTA